MLISTVLALALQVREPDVVTITVPGDEYIRAHTIMIAPHESGGEVWTAERTWDGGSQTVTSVDCPALHEVVQAFEELPPIPVESPVLAVARGGHWPIGPFFLHGSNVSLSFQTTTGDGSVARVQLSGGTTYQLWSHRTVSVLIGCWGPLTP